MSQGTSVSNLIQEERPALFSRHRIIVSKALASAVRHLTPQLLDTFIASEGPMMDQFCIAVNYAEPEEIEYSTLMLQTYETFYACLQHEMHSAECDGVEQLIATYNERLSMDFYHGSDRALTLMLDLLPECVVQNTERSGAWRLGRSAHELNLNHLH